MNFVRADHQDLFSAIENNFIKLLPENFKVLGELLSEHHDKGEYFWLIQDQNTPEYYVLTGGHDYTGWDCQSSLYLSEPFTTLEHLPLFLPEYDNQNRPVRKIIEGQIKTTNFKLFLKDIEQ